MRNIVVIGGGFAGTSAVRRLERRLPAGWQVTLLSEENYMTYTPLLPEVVGASLAPSHAVAPLRTMLRGAAYRRAAVQAIDFPGRTLRYGPGAEHFLQYKHLVLACGSVPNLGFIDGMDRHALPLKTLGDALHIRNRVILALERAELEDDARLRDRLTTFIVIGGGSSGVEVAGAIADFLRAAQRYYPRLRETRAKVIVIESGDRLLSEFPGTLGDSALRSMRGHGIDIRLDTVAATVSDRGVKTEAGDWIEGGNIICTIGTEPNELIRSLALPKEKGRLTTGPDMSVTGQQGVWAIGDCAVVINADTGECSPPTAQFAVRQGRQVADNIVRELEDKPVRAFSYRSRGELATIGHRRAVAQLFGLRLSGFTAWLIWRAVYLFMLPTALRKLQVFSEWSLELLFPRDMTQLHFGRTRSECAVGEQQGDPDMNRAVSR